MNKIIIIAISEKGKKALQDKGEQKKKEMQKGSSFLLNRALKLMGYKEVVTNVEPYTIEISFKHPGAKAQIPTMAIKLQEQFKGLGAEIEKDYTMEVK